MNWFKKILGKKEKNKNDSVDDTSEKNPDSKFKIEHYPITGLYTVRYRNYGWLKTDYHSGIVRVEDFFDVADFHKTEEAARKQIVLFKEQKLKEGMITIDV